MNQTAKSSNQPSSVQEGFDAAGQSLADALRVSFWILKALMVLLLAMYLLSGVFNVQEQDKAVLLSSCRWIIGQPGQQVLEPGGPYFSLPYPFERVVTVPTSAQQIQINKAFWYETNRGDGNGLDPQGRAGPLHPEKDGSLLTGDAEVVHARWSVTYTVDDPIGYLRSVRNTAGARRLVRAVTEQSVVGAVARIKAGQLVRSQHVDSAKGRAQEVLDRIGSGISVTTLSVSDPVFPLSVRPAVQAVLNAESVRAQLIGQAQEQWAQILVGTAGEAYEPLLLLIDAYELASQSSDTPQMAQLAEHMDHALVNLEIRSDDRLRKIGGQVAQMIHEAYTYRTQVAAQVRSEAEYFTTLIPQYRDNPRIVLNRLWQDMIQRILTGDIETIYVPRGQAYLELNRDPSIQLEREKNALIQEEQQMP